MYESPIRLIFDELTTTVDNAIYQAVQNCKIEVNKAELEKALRNDRQEYEHGYEDGRLSMGLRYGEWSKSYDDWGNVQYECSACHKEALCDAWGESCASSCCPHCGADMGKGQKK